MPGAAAAALPREPVAGKLTMTRVLRSEWTKLRSVRSTWWLLWGKLGAVALSLSLASSVAAFVLGELLWQARHGHGRVWFGDPQVTRIVFGAGLVLAVTGIFGLA